MTGNKRKTITVTELPVGRATYTYLKFLEKIREEKLITKFTNQSTANEVHFKIHGMKNPSITSLKLRKTYGLSNMVLLDNNNKPGKYETANDLMETFYYLRLGYYQKRKDNIISEIGNRIELLNKKIKFILAVIKGNEVIKTQPNITEEEANNLEAILVMGNSKAKIKSQMERCGFDVDLLKKVTLYQCTEEEIQTAHQEITDLEANKLVKEKTEPEDLWLDDLGMFLKAYCKHYKCKYKPPKPVSLNLVSTP